MVQLPPIPDTARTATRSARRPCRPMAAGRTCSDVSEPLCRADQRAVCGVTSRSSTSISGSRSLTPGTPRRRSMLRHCAR